MLPVWSHIHRTSIAAVQVVLLLFCAHCSCVSERSDDLNTKPKDVRLSSTFWTALNKYIAPLLYISSTLHYCSSEKPGYVALKYMPPRT